MKLTVKLAIDATTKFLTFQIIKQEPSHLQPLGTIFYCEIDKWIVRIKIENYPDITIYHSSKSINIYLRGPMMDKNNKITEVSFKPLLLKKIILKALREYAKSCKA